MAVIYNEKNQWVKNEATDEFQRLVLPAIDSRTFATQGNVISAPLGFGVSIDAQIEYQRSHSIPYGIPWIITYCVNSLYLLPSDEVLADMYQDVKKYPLGERFPQQPDSNELLSLLYTYLASLPHCLLGAELETNYRQSLLDDFAELVINDAKIGHSVLEGKKEAKVVEIVQSLEITSQQILKECFLFFQNGKYSQHISDFDKQRELGALFDHIYGQLLMGTALKADYRAEFFRMCISRWDLVFNDVGLFATMKRKLLNPNSYLEAEGLQVVHHLSGKKKISIPLAEARDKTCSTVILAHCKSPVAFYEVCQQTFRVVGKNEIFGSLVCSTYGSILYDDLAQASSPRINQSALDTTYARPKTRTTTLGATDKMRHKAPSPSADMENDKGTGTDNAARGNRNKRATSQRELKKIKSEKNVVARDTDAITKKSYSNQNFAAKSALNENVDFKQSKKIEYSLENILVYPDLPLDHMHLASMWDTTKFKPVHLTVYVKPKSPLSMVKLTDGDRRAFLQYCNKIKQVADSSRFFVIESENRRESLGFGFSNKKDECLFKEILMRIFDAERKLKKDNGFNFAQQYDQDLPSPRGTVSFINPWNTEAKIEKHKISSKKSKGGDRKHLATTAAKMESQSVPSSPTRRPVLENSFDVPLGLSMSADSDKRHKLRSPSKAQMESDKVASGTGTLTKEDQASLAKRILELPVNQLLNEKISKDKLLSDLFMSVGPAPTIQRSPTAGGRSSASSSPVATPTTFARNPTARTNANINSTAPNNTNSNSNAASTSANISASGGVSGDSLAENSEPSKEKLLANMFQSESDSVDSASSLIAREPREFKSAPLKRNRTGHNPTSDPEVSLSLSSTEARPVDKEKLLKNKLEAKLVLFSEFLVLIEALKFPHLRDLVINITHAKIHCSKKADEPLPKLILSNIQNLYDDLSLKNRLIKMLNISESNIVEHKESLVVQLDDILALITNFLDCINNYQVNYKENPAGSFIQIEKIYLELSDLTKEIVKTSIDRLRSEVSKMKEEYTDELSEIAGKKLLKNENEIYDPEVIYQYEDNADFV